MKDDYEQWPILMSTATAARYCDFTLASWRKRHKSGRCPLPVSPARPLQWRRADLDAWVAAGCPPRDADAAAAYAAATKSKLDGLGKNSRPKSPPRKTTSA